MPETLSRFQISDTATLRFSAQAFSIFEKYRQIKRRNEAGGILLGRLLAGNEVVVEQATKPGPLDRSGLYFFDRSREAAQKIVNREWEKSHGEVIYLGEWHTHPEDYPSPSCRDRTMIRNMFTDTRMEIDFLILVVVGLQDNWIGVRNKRELRRVNPISRFRDNI
jgi:integrative and conjugative element protein (TIGR02256 family)